MKVKLISALFFILSIYSLKINKRNTDIRGTYSAKKNILNNEFVTDNSEWYIFFQGLGGAKLPKSQFKEYKINFSGQQEVSIPTWTESQLDECNSKCENVFNSLKNKGGFYQFECDVSNSDLNTLYEQYVVEENLYNCYLKRSGPRMKFDKRVMKTRRKLFPMAGK